MLHSSASGQSCLTTTARSTLRFATSALPSATRASAQHNSSRVTMRRLSCCHTAAICVLDLRALYKADSKDRQWRRTHSMHLPSIGLQQWWLERSMSVRA
eukprot:2606665-Amphidinium_carterae.3